MHTRLSCKIDYLLRSNHRDRSIASEFFTDDELKLFPPKQRAAPEAIASRVQRAAVTSANKTATMPTAPRSL
jgi:hypothetical protein